MDDSKLPRIAFVCDGIAEFTAGSVVSTRRFARLLKERGHHIIFIAGKAPGHELSDYWEGMRVYRFRSLLLPKTDERFYMGFPSKKQIRTILKNELVDIVHVVVPTPAAISAVFAARSLGIPVVVHSHTQPENLFLNAMHMRSMWLADLASAALYLYLHWLYAKTQAIIFPTEFSRKLFKGVPSTMLTAVISNGVDAAKFKPRDRKTVCNEFKLDSNFSYLLYVGRLHPEKRVDTLIRAVPLLAKTQPAARALIVGGGHREQELKDLARALGVEDYCLFLGYLSDEDVEKIYSTADIFVLPSLVELEGMVVLQAMAAGNALLVSDSEKSASRFLVDGNGLLFKAGDERDLADKASSMLGNNAGIKNMKSRSLSLAEKYDIHQSVLKIEDVYRSLL